MSGATRWKADAGFGPHPRGDDGCRRVYLVGARMAFSRGAAALEVVAWWGITAIFAATIAVAADDVKKVLAFRPSRSWAIWSGVGVGVLRGLFHLPRMPHSSVLFLGRDPSSMRSYNTLENGSFQTMPHL